jgi:aryl carrier-like protein
MRATLGTPRGHVCVRGKARTDLLDTPAEAIGRDDSFFTLGGDSVRAIRFIERARQELRTELPLAEFFAGPTVRRIAELVTESGGWQVLKEGVL